MINDRDYAILFAKHLMDLIRDQETFGERHNIDSKLERKVIEYLETVS